MAYYNLDGTSKIYVYSDTTGLTASHDIVQIWPRDNLTDINFGVNGKAFANAEGAIIFRGGIYAQWYHKQTII